MQMKLQGYKKNYSNVILMIVLTHTIVNIIWRRPLNELRFPVASTSINTEAGSVDIPGTTMKALNDRPWKAEGDFNNDTTVLSEMRQAHRSCNETTIVLTTNFIPTSPSLAIINRTIHSIRRLKGLCPTAPLIISVDGLNKEARRIHNNSEPRLEEYVNRLRTVYNETHQRVVASNHSLMITGTVYQAMDLVKTEFVYVIQHDMPFIQDIDHTALVRTYDQFPAVLRLVRFNLRPNIQRGDLEGNNTCYAEETPVNDVNGISLIKTWIWSDNNHFTRKSYYDEMKELFYKRHGRLPFAMEWVMRVEGQKNCSYWGTFYYGPQGQAPTIAHMDGRQTTQVAENEDLRLRRWMR